MQTYSEQSHWISFYHLDMLIALTMTASLTLHLNVKFTCQYILHDLHGTYTCTSLNIVLTFCLFGFFCLFVFIFCLFLFAIALLAIGWAFESHYKCTSRYWTRQRCNSNVSDVNKSVSNICKTCRRLAVVYLGAIIYVEINSCLIIQDVNHGLTQLDAVAELGTFTACRGMSVAFHGIRLLLRECSW